MNTINNFWIQTSVGKVTRRTKQSFSISVQGSLKDFKVSIRLYFVTTLNLEIVRNNVPSEGFKQLWEVKSLVTLHLNRVETVNISHEILNLNFQDNKDLEVDNINLYANVYKNLVTRNVNFMKNYPAKDYRSVDNILIGLQKNNQIDKVETYNIEAQERKIEDTVQIQVVVRRDEVLVTVIKA